MNPSTAHLLDALSTAAPEHAACHGDDRFTADMPGGASLRVRRLHAEMRAVCGACPLLLLCAETADALQPTDGFWAGKAWSRGWRRSQERAARRG